MLVETQPFGLPENVMHSLGKVLESTPEVEEAIIFGSRAKGNYHPGSDIDLTIKGPAVSLNTILTLMSKTEDLGLLYKIDFQTYSTIADEAMLNHIDRVGKLFWKR